MQPISMINDHLRNGSLGPQPRELGVGVRSQGLEETVPLNVVSVPGGPVVSVIGDYDGLRHSDVAANAPIHTPRMGTTTGLAHAAANNGAMVCTGNDMYYTWDGGWNWTKTTMNGIKGQVALSPTVRPMAIS